MTLIYQTTIYNQANEIIGFALLALLAIGIIIGYKLFFKSVKIQNRMEAGTWPMAKKPTRAEIIEANDKEVDLDTKLMHKNKEELFLGN